MSISRKLMLALLTFLTVGLGQVPAHAAVIVAQLIDSNPGIRGLTYIDGLLTQDELLGDEVYDGRFTGFILQDPGLLVEDVGQRINIFDSGGKNLIATLAYGGNVGTNFVHTSYFSDSDDYELTPVVFPTLSLIADGSMQTVLELSSDTGDQYIFQYQYIPAAVPEPSTIALLSIAACALGFMRRRRYQQTPAPRGDIAGAPEA